MRVKNKNTNNNLINGGGENLFTEKIFNDMYKIIKDDLIVREFIKKDKSTEYNLNKRKEVYRTIENSFEKLTFDKINKKDTKFFLDDHAQAYYFNLWDKIYRIPTTPININANDGDPYVSYNITLFGVLATPIKLKKSSNIIGAHSRQTDYFEKIKEQSYKSLEKIQSNSKNINIIGGSVLLGKNPTPPNLLYIPYYSVPAWSNFTKANHYLYIYSMQLPYQFNRVILLQTFVDLMYVHEIKTLLNLHGCDTYSNTGFDCNKDDINCEGEVWELTKNITQATRRDPNIRYISAGIKDFESGHITLWENIFKNIGNTIDPNNSITIHCLAGRGRTGGVVLALLLRDILPLSFFQSKMHLPHLGFNTIDELIINLETLFDTNQNSRDIFDELFDTQNLTYVRLLRARLNCIFFCIAQYHNISKVCLYCKPVNLQGIYTVEFSLPVVIEIDWSTSSAKDVSHNENAIFFEQ
jgi:hypothetical protein